jgi:hypothetical protein
VCRHRKRTFSRYIDTGTGHELAPHVGRCDREDSCGYHLSPSQYLKEAGLVSGASSSRHRANQKIKKRSSRHAATEDPHKDIEYYIHPEYVNDSFVNYDQNNFVQYLVNRFGLDTADKLGGRYRIGTSSYWHGATIFWQLDTHGYVRTGKIMLYDKQTGKRVKEPFNHVNWVHSLLMKDAEARQLDNGLAIGYRTCDFKLKQCLFGEHLLITAPNTAVAIVESEKTAIIASHYLPGFIWLACGSLQGLSVDKCRILQNRRVVLFPDVNAYSKWKVKAAELRRALPGTEITVSDDLERIATADDRKKGIDIADVLR